MIFLIQPVRAQLLRYDGEGWHAGVPVLLRRGVLASSIAAPAGLSGTLLRKDAKDLAMGLRGDEATSRLSFLGFFHVGRQLFLT